MSAAENPHDSVVRQILGRPETAAEYFQQGLPAELTEKIDFSTMERVPGSFIDPELHPSASDLLFTANYFSSGAAQPERLLLYLLIEHKSYPDRMTLFQLLRYMVRIWERHCSENRKAAFLPPVCPVILYHGRKPWPFSLNFHSLISAQEPLLLRHLPDFAPVLHDVTRLADEEITGGAAAGTLLLLLKHIFSPDLAERLPDILLRARALLRDENGREIMFTLLYYLTGGTGRVDEKTLAQALDRAAPGGEMMKSFLKKYFDQGRQEGEIRLLIRLLRKRFGELPSWAEERLRQASAGMLEIWSERILTASKLEDVFAEPGR
jgi:predicted transposase/invertase (TIGR01784 family)